MPTSTVPSHSDRPVFQGLFLISGHAALDLVNTVKYRGADDPQDKLTSLSDIIMWARVAGLLSETESRKLTRLSRSRADGKRLCREVCRFREDVRILFETTRPHSARYARAASHVEKAISMLRPIATIDRISGELTRLIMVRTADDLKARIVAEVAEMLSERADLRIKTCGGSDCDWLFIDRTKAGHRQWCDTRTCGNIARVRRFRMRH
jgi:predicted RNA-binding Zn ribbon-like protein